MDNRPSTLHEDEASYLKTVITDAIRRNNGVMSRAAADLGISRETLYRRIAKYGIEIQAAASNDIERGLSIRPFFYIAHISIIVRSRGVAQPG